MKKSKGDLTHQFNSRVSDYARKKCYCGHSVIMLPSTKFIICNHCGRKIINDTKGRFMYVMLNKGVLVDKNK